MKNKPKINFFTYVDKKYYHFVLPYIFSVLKNTDASVEIILEDGEAFYNIYGKKLANIKLALSEVCRTFIYTENSLKGVIPNTTRFLKEPQNNADYTYITDCDMIITKKLYEKAIENNLAAMEKNKTCFFNIKRENREVLSGVHFVKNAEYYPKLVQFLKGIQHKEDFIKTINALGDEGFLYEFVKGTWGDPEKLTKDNVRILPGEHISPNRNKKYTAIKEELCRDEAWKYAFTQFDKKFLGLF